MISDGVVIQNDKKAEDSKLVQVEAVRGPSNVKGPSRVVDMLESYGGNMIEERVTDSLRSRLIAHLSTWVSDAWLKSQDAAKCCRRVACLRDVIPPFDNMPGPRDASTTEHKTSFMESCEVSPVSISTVVYFVNRDLRSAIRLVY